MPNRYHRRSQSEPWSPPFAKSPGPFALCSDDTEESAVPHHRRAQSEPWEPAFAQPLPQHTFPPVLHAPSQAEGSGIQSLQTRQPSSFDGNYTWSAQNHPTTPPQVPAFPLQPPPAGAPHMSSGGINGVLQNRPLQFQGMNIIDKVTIGGGSGRNLAERLSWSAEDDAKIVASVRQHGCKWRLIASFFAGRSDDAVRNRFNRVKDLPEHNDGRAAPPKPPKPVTSRPPAGVNGSTPPRASRHAPHLSLDDADDDRRDRVSWSRQEDETILRSVGEVGHKWHRIAQRLPGRTEHAIRNRFARLQSLANRGKPIVLSSGVGQPIGIQLVVSQIPGAPSEHHMELEKIASGI